MKILHLQTELNLACGITRTISQIIRNSHPEFEHHIIALGGDGLSRFENINFKPIILNQNRFSLLGTFRILIFLLRYCKKKSIRIIHSHHRYFDLLASLLEIITKIKTVTSVQSKVYRKSFFSYKADQLIACSNTIKTHLIKNFNVQGNRVKVIYNSVDPYIVKINIEKEKLKSQLGIGLNDFIIGFVGRINYREKGIDVLLESFNLLSKSNLQTHLLIIGDGSDHKKVENYCYINKLKVTLLPSKENIFDFYNLMDVVVLPSKIEPFGIVVIEAGLMKKAFIGSNVDGIPELIVQEENGLLFESGNFEDLKNQIIKIIKDDKLRMKLAGNLNKKVMESFTIDKIIPQYEKLYKEIMIE